MTLKQVQKLLDLKPFRPLVFTMEGGKQYALMHPENIQYTIAGSFIMRYNGDEFTCFDPEGVLAIEFRRVRRRRKS